MPNQKSRIIAYGIHFHEKVKELVGDEYTFLETYVSAKITLLVRHNICLNEYKALPSKFLKGKGRCLVCLGRIKTTETFKKEIFDLTVDEYELVGEYLGAKTKNEFLHTKCGNKFYSLPAVFLNGIGCQQKECTKTLKAKTHEQYVEQIYDIYGDEFTVMSTYKKDIKRITIKHNVCNTISEIAPQGLLKAKVCHFCTAEKRNQPMKSNEQYKEYLFSKLGAEYENLEPYKGSETKILYIHNSCGRTFYKTPVNLLNTLGCDHCSKDNLGKNMTKSHEEYSKQVEDLTDGEYKVIGKYINSHVKVEILHESCKMSWFIQPSSFLCGTRCPRCKESSGEKSISKFLENSNYKYARQFTFPDCRNKNKLRFDFGVIDKNNKLLLLIEYDGQQHYKQNDRFGGEDGFKKTKRRDEIKNEYCLKNNIPLLRIPYWDFSNLEDILESELSKYCLN